MAKDESTITGALGIQDEDFSEAIDKFVKSTLMVSDKVSDLIEKTGEHIKNEEFNGEYELGEYEKKLLFAGMVIGKCMMQQREIGSLIEKLSSGLGAILKMEERKKKDNDGSENE